MYFHDRIKETSTSTGTGNFTLLGAVSQFKSFTSSFQVGDTFFYCIVGQTGTEWETGQGYLSNSTTLVRDTVLESSNANAFVTFSASTKDVFVTAPSLYFNNDLGIDVAGINGFHLP